MNKTPKTRLARLEKRLREIVAYPPKGSDRRTEDGYPTEIVYDEWAYCRMVDSYREAIRDALKKSKKTAK